uniref:Uncharacterized protein n=1 Tax=Tetradesmus obliquus TaxID=3088 RepID=A0A383WCQ2_TETOB|eukprot:jgi/Sobl393_1/120/SZX74859.1
MAPKGRSAVWSHLKVQQAVDELSAAANDLTQQQSGKIAELIDYLKTGIPTIPAFGDLLRSTPVLSVLLSVVTARMQRQDLRQQELPLFWEVCIGLTQCIGGWQGLSMVNPDFFGREPSLEQQLVTAGLLPALAKTAASLTIALKQQQQQDVPETTKHYDVQDCLRLSCAVLHTWKIMPMMLQQRGSALIQPSLLQMTQLAMATLRASATTAPSTLSSRNRFSRSSGSTLETISLHENAVKQAAGTGSVLATALGHGIMTDTAGVRQQLQQHAELLELLLAIVAAMASQRYYQKDGKTIVQTGSQTSSRSSSSKASSSKAAQSSTQQRKREFPALHKRLFGALGCANAGEVLGVPEDETSAEAAVEGAAQACSMACTALQLLGDPQIAAELSSSSARQEVQQQQQQQQQWRQLLKPEVCLGLLDATTQLLLLQPDLAVADSALAMVFQACSNTCAAAEQHRWQGALWTHASAVDCMRKLLTQLVPAVQHSLQAGSNRPEGRRGRAEQESATRYGLGRLLTIVALMADDVLLVPVVSADLAGTAAAFEAALRCQCRASDAELETFDGMSMDELLYALHRIEHTISLAAGFSFSWSQ